MGKLEGRVAFIAGSAKGIGKAIARCFAGEGASVACADIVAEGAGAVAAQIEASGGRALAIGCDVNDSASVAAAVAATVSAFGALHVVSSNAAVITAPRPLAEMEEQEWRRAMDVNVTGSFLVCKHAIPAMIVAGGGSIILTASQMASVAYAGSTTYCTTKGALLQLAQGIALDYADQKIRANTLSPGGVATDRQLVRFADMATAQREWGARHPMGRLGEPEEIARAALFLASEDSSFMTGADLLVDGGYSAW
jgi:NAD(P)-dependent dehydrogenase (short-subunit alcohol dehydrogenase family)